LRRGANPAEVTDVFVFLAPDESKSVTGKRFQAQENWKAPKPRLLETMDTGLLGCTRFTQFVGPNAGRH
jgi:hypothetical protein